MSRASQREDREQPRARTDRRSGDRSAAEDLRDPEVRETDVERSHDVYIRRVDAQPTWKKWLNRILIVGGIALGVYWFRHLLRANAHLRFSRVPQAEVERTMGFTAVINDSNRSTPGGHSSATTSPDTQPVPYNF